MNTNIFNSQKVKKTLLLATEIFDKYHTEYRILGSVATAGMMGKQHRKLGDIDFLADIKNKQKILNEFYNLGYKDKGGMFSFARKYLYLDTLIHDKYLEVGIFWGSWKNGFLIGSSNNGVSIDNKAVKKQRYNLHDINFWGLPKETIARGLLMSSSNPKRKKALEYISQNNINPMKSDYVHINIFGMKFDYVYYLVMNLLNIIGFIRVRLGKPFDPWR